MTAGLVRGPALARPLLRAALAARAAPDRVTAGGVLRVAGAPAPPGPGYVIGSPLPGDPAPAAPPLPERELERLAEFLRAARGEALVLTGAGLGTESGIPDYRSPNGAYSAGHRPMTHQAFVASAANRSRYWARSYAGWRGFTAAAPHAGHEALARLERLGWLAGGGVITQNVDRLHQRAGSRRVLELHGSTHDVRCMGECGAVTPRAALQEALAALNPRVAAPAAADLRDEGARAPAPAARPDGDAEVELAAGEEPFRVPPCPDCGGFIMPDVVFFGANLPAERAAAALAAASKAKALLVVGSSLSTWSAFRLAKATAEGGGALAILNVGPTRADDLAALRLSARAGEALARLAAHPALLVPPARGG